MVNSFASTYNYLLSFSGLYYGVSICLVTFASALAVVTLNLHHRGVRGSRVPGIVRSLVLDKLARIVLLNFQEEKRSVRSMCVSLERALIYFPSNLAINDARFALGTGRTAKKKKQLSTALQTGAGPIAIVAQVRNQKGGE